MTARIGSNPAAGFAGINLACGGKLCLQTGWINADHCPSSKDVMQVNLLKRLPFQDNTFDVVYHSQFIEHLSLESAQVFLDECCRVLKPNGVLRVVTPDLENQAAEYLLNLREVLVDPNDEAARLRYYWIRLEMLDQLTRHTPGGDMVTFLWRSGAKIRDYLCQRMGRSGENLIPPPESPVKGASIKDGLRSLKRTLLGGCIKGVYEPLRVGKFRLSGELHLCMFDQYLLSTLLAKARFVKIAKVTAKESVIPDWDLTLLDCDRQGNPDCQVSLFMEAVKQPMAKT